MRFIEGIKKMFVYFNNEGFEKLIKLEFFSTYEKQGKPRIKFNY